MNTKNSFIFNCIENVLQSIRNGDYKHRVFTDRENVQKIMRGCSGFAIVQTEEDITGWESARNWTLLVKPLPSFED